MNTEETKPEEPKSEVLPPQQTFEIDDDNFIFNGEAFFNLAEVKSVIKTVNAQQPNVGVILFNFVGSQMGMPIASMEDRDNIFEEIRRRLIAIKNGSIGKYIAEQKKSRLAQKFLPGNGA